VNLTVQKNAIRNSCEGEHPEGETACCVNAILQNVHCSILRVGASIKGRQNVNKDYNTFSAPLNTQFNISSKNGFYYLSVIFEASDALFRFSGGLIIIRIKKNTTFHSFHF